MTMITKEQFQAYEEVRESGATNMWDTNMVSELSEDVLSSNDALEVIKNTLADNHTQEFKHVVQFCKQFFKR